MTSLPRFRVAVAAGLTLGTAVAVLAIGTTASAAPQTAPAAAPTVPSEVVAGTPFTVAGAGCRAVDGPASAVVLTDEAVAIGDVAVGAADRDGTWSLTLSFPSGTDGGVHEVGAVCRSSDAGASTEVAYPIVAVTVIPTAGSRR